MSNGERRVCLITGAGGRLGDAFCRATYTHYDIVAVCRNRVPAAPSQEEWFVDPLDPQRPVPQNASRVFVVRSDLTEPGEPERVVDLALAKFGRVDLLVNNAANMALHPLGVVDGDAALDAFAPVFTLNVEVPLRLATRLAQRSWLHDDAGNRANNRNVVNVSSMSGPEVFGGQTLYGTSKAALNKLTRHLADEFDEFGVRVNAIAPDAFPGSIPTSQVVRAIVELDSGEMTGTVFSVVPAPRGPGGRPARTADAKPPPAPPPRGASRARGSGGPPPPGPRPPRHARTAEA
ncbi:SDR family NAD(P)-dependent oxidoreductase [Nocardia cyriacigeorgica]|uniref:SDR family NAD(P)-dependent oxidoreductase n=1 Tax=Nocardia cyriacigeorgica TaxID=135487 RepID=UPI0024544184|nr:SDR family NAD(P)-dependent oxidoreductase [Nocardia cyriacigeorgica]